MLKFVSTKPPRGKYGYATGQYEQDTSSHAPRYTKTRRARSRLLPRGGTYSNTSSIGREGYPQYYQYPLRQQVYRMTRGAEDSAHEFTESEMEEANYDNVFESDAESHQSSSSIPVYRHPLSTTPSDGAPPIPPPPVYGAPPIPPPPVYGAPPIASPPVYGAQTSTTHAYRYPTSMASVYGTPPMTSHSYAPSPLVMQNTYSSHNSSYHTAQTAPVSSTVQIATISSTTQAAPFSSTAQTFDCSPDMSADYLTDSPSSTLKRHVSWDPEVKGGNQNKHQIATTTNDTSVKRMISPERSDSERESDGVREKASKKREGRAKKFFKGLKYFKGMGSLEPGHRKKEKSRGRMIDSSDDDTDIRPRYGQSQHYGSPYSVSKIETESSQSEISSPAVLRSQVKTQDSSHRLSYLSDDQEIMDQDYDIAESEDPSYKTRLQRLIANFEHKAKGERVKPVRTLKKDESSRSDQHFPHVSKHDQFSQSVPHFSKDDGDYDQPEAFSFLSSSSQHDTEKKAKPAVVTEAHQKAQPSKVTQNWLSGLYARPDISSATSTLSRPSATDDSDWEEAGTFRYYPASGPKAASSSTSRLFKEQGGQPSWKTSGSHEVKETKRWQEEKPVSKITEKKVSLFFSASCNSTDFSTHLASITYI